MTQGSAQPTQRRIRVWLCAGVLLACASLLVFGTNLSSFGLRSGSGSPQLVSIQPLGEADGEMCQWMPASARPSVAPELVAQDPSSASAVSASAVSGSDAAAPQSHEIDPAPIRELKDENPTFSAVAVDPVRNEIILQDENLYQILAYDRLANTPPSARLTEPKRILGGLKTDIEFNCGLYVDPANGDIYSVNNDTLDETVVFSHGMQGNVPPTRELHTPHGTYGIAVDEQDGEIFFTTEHDNAVVAYKKEAKGDDLPLRLIQGDSTKLADPHGIAVDPKNNWIFVANHGSTHSVRADLGKPLPPTWPLTRVYAVPGSGELWPPSINVYDRTAHGDARPLRVIQGPNTRLDWPAQIFLDRQQGELFVANDGSDSVLVFREMDEGNAAPIRAIQGPKTGLKNPTGLWVDTANNEVVVSNMGNHSATVFSRTADGNAAPLRVIRAAPLDQKALAIGNPGGVAYDSKRDEILVPN